jgi:hypothetical protein
VHPWRRGLAISSAIYVEKTHKMLPEIVATFVRGLRPRWVAIRKGEVENAIRITSTPCSISTSKQTLFFFMKMTSHGIYRRVVRRKPLLTSSGYVSFMIPESSSLTNSPTPRSGALLEKPLVAQLLKNSPIFYGTRMFITVFKRAPPLLLILSQINPVHTTPSCLMIM